MSNALEAAKRIADDDPDAPEKPCRDAQFRERRPCRGGLWLCGNEDSEHHGLAVRGDHCRERCEERARPGGMDRVERAQTTTTTMAEPIPTSTTAAGDGLPDAGARLPTLSMIFTVYDEDLDEVRATLESAAAAYPDDKLGIVVVDDGADPVKSAVSGADTGGAEVVYARHKDNQGVGRSRNRGLELAYEKADVVSFHDAHMRFPLYDEMAGEAEAVGNELDMPRGWSSLMCLARKAASGWTIISSASRDTRNDRDFWASGADMFWNRRDALQPKWRMPGNFETPWVQVPCMMGAGYFMSRGTAETLMATGQLWEDTAGLWGFSEQALSVKAFLLGVPIYAARDIFTRHLYRGSNPVPGAGKEVWKNVCRCTSRLFPRDIYEARFRPYVQKRLGEDGEAEHRAEPAGIAIRERGWKVFTHLVGKRAPVTERHPDHEWLQDVASAMSHVWASFGGTRVLVWGPGEALFTVQQICPDADITVIARPGPRANNWWDICRESRQTTREAGDNQSRRHSAESLDGCNPSTATGGIDIVKARLTDDYVERPVNRDWGPFDVVLINGPLQDECAHIAKRVLAKGGKIIRNERQDRLQLEDEQREKEESDIEAALNKRERAATEGAHPPGDPASEVGPLTVTAPPGGWPATRSYMPVLTDVLREMEPDRILEWGPGFSTGVMHTYCPDADIVTTEHQEGRAKMMRGTYPYADVRHEELTDYGKCDYAAWPFLEDAGPFDLAFVDGRRRTECLLAARKVLARDGIVVLHDSDRRNYDLGREFYELVREENRTAVLKPRRGRE